MQCARPSGQRPPAGAGSFNEVKPTRRGHGQNVAHPKRTLGARRPTFDQVTLTSMGFGMVMRQGSQPALRSLEASSLIFGASASPAAIALNRFRSSIVIER